MTFYVFLVADIKLWYRSQRTILGKLQKKKNGHERCRLTARQNWVKKNLGFLTTHIVHRPQGCQLGQVANNDDDDSEPSSFVQWVPVKKRQKGQDIDAVLLEYLEKSPKPVGAMSHVSDEKQAWVEWMLQVLRPLPKHLW